MFTSFHRPDIYTPDGKYIEVKTSRFQGRGVELILSADEMDFEWICLVQAKLPDQGWVFPIWSKSYLDPLLQKQNYGYGDRYTFRPEDHNGGANQQAV